MSTAVDSSTPDESDTPDETDVSDDSNDVRARPADAPAGVRRRDPGPPSGAGGTGNARSRLPWVLVAVLLVTTLGFGLAWQSERGGNDLAGAGTAAESGSAGELRSTATRFAEALTNFDGATIARDVDRIAALSSGEFRSQLDQFFSTEIRGQLKEAQASSRGEVRSAFVQTAEADRGTVFVVVDQTIANNQSPQPQADTLRMELALVRKAEGEGWRVERVAVLTAPSGGSTVTGDAGPPASTPTSAPTATTGPAGD